MFFYIVIFLLHHHLAAVSHGPFLGTVVCCCLLTKVPLKESLSCLRLPSWSTMCEGSFGSDSTQWLSESAGKSSQPSWKTQFTLQASQPLKTPSNLCLLCTSLVQGCAKQPALHQAQDLKRTWLPLERCL